MFLENVVRNCPQHPRTVSLEDCILSYLDAIKLSSLAEMPIEEVMKYYRLLSGALNYSFMSRPASADFGLGGPDKMKQTAISEGVISSLKSQLAAIIITELNFCDEVKVEIESFINMVCSSIMPDKGEAVPSKGAL